VLQNLAEAGFPGAVYPVNPKYKKIGEQQCFAAVADLPQAVDLAVICTPAQTVAQVVRECGEAGILGLVIPRVGERR
jgi:acetyltransferase